MDAEKLKKIKLLKQEIEEQLSHINQRIDSLTEQRALLFRQKNRIQALIDGQTDANAVILLTDMVTEG
jgi:hypothetical protein